MNHSVSEITGADCCSPATIRMFLQQAVDHYQRLVAFSFTLTLPYCKSMTDYRSLILRFHTEVWQRTGEYSWQRQQERRNSPPTLLRWIWGSLSAPECRMVLMMNLSTLDTGACAQRTENPVQVMSELLREAWLKVAGAVLPGVSHITPVILCRSDRRVFTARACQLNAQVQAMARPVTTSRSGVTG
ncbi:DUF3296 domain-containing protein [Enterobacter ludwigii]|uniref:DUF3296 domain-containing protein n=1 Tax=Enterobacter ludwigii TaxID=299767 RepID=UPI001E2D7995|nr:DUF3296 domain-containing protein [Enterobacter ludwigii]MCE1626812.1 DUF3296 domain-containing protein [Enterobacter ludwigii]